MSRALHVQAASVLLAGLLVAGTARADDVTPLDRAQGGDDATRHAVDRTWLYADDARVPEPMSVVGLSSLSYTDVGPSPTRVAVPYQAFAANTAQPGGMLSLGGEVGLVPRVSVMAIGQMGVGGIGPSPNAGAIAGVRLQAFPSTWQNAHMVVSLGYLREAWQGPVFDDGVWRPGSPNGDNGAWLQVALSGDVQRLRMAGTLHGEHVFADGRDAVDVMVQAGISYRIVGELRAGVEYVGQDLEESFDDGAEGGARHFIGPTASVQLLRDRLTIVAGPSFGLSELSPRLLGRFALAYGF